MKTAPATKVLVLLVAVVAMAGAAQARMSIHDGFDCDLFRGEDITIDFDDDILYIECEDEDGVVEITGDHELYVNGEKIELDRGERKLVEDYYEDLDEILDIARDMGVEGARIGAKGAKLGISAIAKVIRLLSEDYDSDDLEKEMDREAKKLEREAEKLERMGEELEDIADHFERTHRKLRKSIDELDDLGWF